MARVPPGVGVNPITITTRDASGRVSEQKDYEITRTNLIPYDEIEPYDGYKEVQRLAAPVVIRGNPAYGDFYDTYRITVDSDRTCTVVITDIADETITDYTPYPHLSFPLFVVEDHLTLHITDSSDDRYFSPEPV